MHKILCTLVLLLSQSCAHARTSKATVNSTAVSPSQWHGFNLLDMFFKGWKESRFAERDFQTIQKLGFNFVRIPLDYRIWTSEKDYYALDESKLTWIDEAVAYGQKYGLHVCLSLHRVPGYADSDDQPEKGNLWTEADMQKAYIFQWQTFAKRYANIPAASLSFDLLNEPTGAAEETITALFKKTITEIHRISSSRPIIIDGFHWATEPNLELAKLPVIQATRGYKPRDIVRETKDRPKPTWPQLRLNRFLYGDGKPKAQSKLTFSGSFAKGVVSIFVDQVSDEAKLQIFADGIKIAEKPFKPGPGAGEWQEVIYEPKWRIYQNRYNKQFHFEIPKAKEISFFVSKGDWLSFKEISWQANGVTPITISATDFSDDTPQEVVYLNPSGSIDVTRSPMFDRAWLMKTQVQPWIDLKKMGVQVFVGETGAPKTAPHDVYLAWMKDNLDNWKQAGLGWALWNFKGEFGIFNSERPDVTYEDYDGYKLDRNFLTLLQGYL